MKRGLPEHLRTNSPRVIAEAVALYGTKEIAGSGNNPVILSWAKELKIQNYNSDEIPWCGLFVAIVVKRAGFDIISNPLWARAWARWGSSQNVAMLGDVLVFARGAANGHVGFYVGEDESTYYVLGGNQSNKVNIVRIPKKRLLSIRRCLWKVSQPPNVRRIFLRNNAPISSNEQ